MAVGKNLSQKAQLLQVKLIPFIDNLASPDILYIDLM
jgi:hypothetical protein